MAIRTQDDQRALVLGFGLVDLAIPSPPCLFGYEHPYAGAMRYFSCSADNGRLYMHYITGNGLIYDEADTLPPNGQCIDSVEALDALLRESVGQSFPLTMVYLAEGLEDEAQRRGPR